MLNDHTLRARIIRAALERAETQGWRQLALSDVAAAAGVSLADVAREFRGKADILEAFQREVDATVLAKSDVDPDETARDRVFDVVMTRFEVLAPYKRALRRILRDLRGHPGASGRALCQSARSHAWMLRAAGIDPEGDTGWLRVTGLMSVYGQTIPVWLEDDDPGLARTMAALDRRLRRGESWLMRVEGFAGAACRLANALRPRRRDRGGDAPATDTAMPDGDGAPEPSAG